MDEEDIKEETDEKEGKEYTFTAKILYKSEIWRKYRKVVRVEIELEKEIEEEAEEEGFDFDLPRIQEGSSKKGNSIKMWIKFSSGLLKI